jgi:hypothetical protein
MFMMPLINHIVIKFGPKIIISLREHFGSTVVERFNRDPKIEGSNPASDTGTGIMRKK